MRIEQLEYFLSIVDCGSIRAAAQRLGLSQPAVSTAIKSLEEELGQKLFLREIQGVSLSPFGNKIFDDAQCIVAKARAIKTLGAIAPSTVLRICAQPVITAFLTRYLFHDFKERHQNIEIHTFNTLSIDIFNTICNCEIDIAIMTTGKGINLHKQVFGLGNNITYLFTDERKIFLSATNRYANKKELTLDDLKHITIIYYSSPHDNVSSYYTKYIKFAGEYRVANREDILDLVLHDEGAFIQPERLFSSDDRVQNGLIKAKKIAVPGLDNATPVFAMLCRQESSGAVRELWDFLIRNFRTYLPAIQE